MMETALPLVLSKTLTQIHTGGVSTIASLLEITHSGVYQVSASVMWGKGYGKRSTRIVCGTDLLSQVGYAGREVVIDEYLDDDDKLVQLKKKLDSEYYLSIAGFLELQRGEVIRLECYHDGGAIEVSTTISTVLLKDGD